MQTRPPHQVGNLYSREAIRTQNDADNINDVYYLQHAGEQVVALCLRKDTNPEAPSQVWVGAGPKVEVWGRRLAKAGLKVPVYIRPSSVGNFTFHGWHEVTERQYTAPELAAAMACPNIGKLSRIVFLKKV